MKTGPSEGLCLADGRSDVGANGRVIEQGFESPSVCGSDVGHRLIGGAFVCPVDHRSMGMNLHHRILGHGQEPLLVVFCVFHAFGERVLDEGHAWHACTTHHHHALTDQVLLPGEVFRFGVSDMRIAFCAPQLHEVAEDDGGSVQ